jgi:undecaprenyl-diphosphatase
MGIPIAIFLGIVQGLTEFLPVSSSGHLVIAQQLYPAGLDHALAFDVCLHFGTLLAVVVYFRADLFGMARSVLGGSKAAEPYLQRWVVMLVIATLPIIVVGLALREPVAHAFTSLTAVGLALLVTASLLTLAGRLPGGSMTPERLTVRDALIIGAFQALAIVPGISRSGATITGCLSRGLAPDAAARFAFLLSLPAITGAVVLNIGGVTELLRSDGAAVVAGTLAAAITGWLAIDVMMKAIRLGRLAPFAVYCAILGTVTLLMGLV